MNSYWLVINLTFALGNFLELFSQVGFDSRLVEPWMCYLWMWRTNCAYNPNTAPGLNSKQCTKNRLITSLCCVEVSRSLANNLVSRRKKEPSCLAGGESETAFYSTVGNGWLDQGEFYHEPLNSYKGPYYCLGL